MTTYVRWDILAEHLDEAAFLSSQWNAAFRSARLALADIEAGIERRLLAHLDGLVLGGNRSAAKLLLPQLADADPQVAFAAAFALAEAPAFFGPLLDALRARKPEDRAPLRQALAIAPRAALSTELLSALQQPGSLAADLLLILAARRVDPGFALNALFNSSDPALQNAALRIARLFPDRLPPEATALGLRSSHSSVQIAAIETGLVWNHPLAIPTCREIVKTGGPAFSIAALGLGLFGDPESIELLGTALSTPERALAAAFALGVTGRLTAADRLIERMSDKRLARLAGEGFTNITGISLEGELCRPATEDEELSGPEANLPLPVPEAVARRWAELRSTFDPAVRLLRGRPRNAAMLAAELRKGVARRRPACALGLAIETRGKSNFISEGFARWQREQAA